MSFDWLHWTCAATCKSDKPRDDYSDCLLRANDINAVIREMGVQPTLVCGWPYGRLLILAYIRQNGENAISGIAFVGALAKLGSEAALSVLTLELLPLVPGLFATDVEESVQTVKAFLRLCFFQKPRADRLVSLTVPPHVRQPLFSPSLDNEHLLSRIRKPALVVHGAGRCDGQAVILEQHKAGMAHAQVQVISDAQKYPGFPMQLNGSIGWRIRFGTCVTWLRRSPRSHSRYRSDCSR
jgi:non-heme chloroperoxidase